MDYADTDVVGRESFLLLFVPVLGQYHTSDAFFITLCILEFYTRKSCCIVFSNYISRCIILLHLLFSRLRPCFCQPIIAERAKEVEVHSSNASVVVNWLMLSAWLLRSLLTFKKEKNYFSVCSHPLHFITHFFAIHWLSITSLSVPIIDSWWFTKWNSVPFLSF